MNNNDKPSIIALDSLGLRFGKHQVLSDLTIELKGRAIGLLGPNGAGKTSLIHTLLGFHPPSAGSASILGHDINQDIGELRQRIGYMPERDAFIPGMTAVRLVSYMGELSGLPPKVALERAHETLYYVGLGEARYREVQSFSLGMKQKVKLAQALVHGPELIFLDEPTNGLDPRARRRMIELIREIRDTGLASIILSSHLLHDVELCCEEVVVLKAGRLAVYCDLEAERHDHRAFLDIEYVGDGECFAEGLAALGAETATTNAGHLKTIIPETVNTQQLYQLAKDCDVSIRGLSRKQDTLEDIFLKAMGPGGMTMDLPDTALAEEQVNGRV